MLKKETKLDKTVHRGIFTHPKTGKTTLQFSVFNELKPQNPKSWIYRM